MYVLLQPSVKVPIKPAPLLLPEQESVERAAGEEVPVQTSVEEDTLEDVVVAVDDPPPTGAAVMEALCEVEEEEKLCITNILVSLLFPRVRYHYTYACGRRRRWSGTSNAGCHGNVVLSVAEQLVGTFLQVA